MNALRQQMSQHADSAALGVKTQLDWKSQVRAHPWLTAAAAGIVGYLLVPRGKERITKQIADPEVISRLVAEDRLVVKADASDESSNASFASKLMAIGLAVGGKAAASYASNLISQSLAGSQLGEEQVEEVASVTQPR